MLTDERTGGNRAEPISDLQPLVRIYSIVVYGGVRSRQEEVLAYAAAGIGMHIIGDAPEPGSIQKSIRSVYGIVSSI